MFRRTKPASSKVFAWTSLVWLSLMLPASSSAEKPKGAVGMEEFSLELYQSLSAKAEENLVLSPLGVYALLHVISFGSDGETKSELVRALHAEADKDAQKQTAGLIQKLNTLDQSAADSLSIANAAWIKKDYQLKSGFAELLTQDYRAHFAALDFEKRAEAAGVMNQWVSDKTKGKIKELFREDDIQALTRVVLSNTVYFKARWENEFNQHVTATEPFYVSPEEQIEVQMMADIQTRPYFEDEQVQVLSLPYKGQEIEFLLVLPKERHALSQLEKGLSAKRFREWRDKMKDARVQYHLPRFSFSKKLDLQEALKALGIKNAFDPAKASFPGISEEKELSISKILQEAFIGVDEQGTEAAAATGAIMAGSAFNPEQPKLFRADHPFLFYIRHKATNALLFLGRVQRP